MQSRLMRVTAAAALSICMGTSSALAASVTQPGELVGLPSGTPLPPGLYFANTADWGCRNSSPTSCLGVTIPVVTWSSPWTFLGGRVQFFSVTPVIETGVQNTSSLFLANRLSAPESARTDSGFVGRTTADFYLVSKLPSGCGDGSRSSSRLKVLSTAR
jgi:hypothetical protein